MKVTGKDHVAAWLRTFAVQGSWNYKTLLGTGIGYAMLPLLRRIHVDDPVRQTDAAGRHLASFNCHPYLSGAAVASLSRLEADGAATETIERFRLALRGPLGRLGDQLVWAEWRPFCALISMLLFVGGIGALASAAIFLVVYNAGHIWLRVWAYRMGWRTGLEMGRALQASFPSRVAGRLRPANQFLLGVLAPLLATRLTAVTVEASTWPLVVLGMPVALYAFRWPTRGSRLAGIFLLSVPLVWFLILILNTA